ncbi:unnamed protein product [Scytosiphon promiscuus]
MAAGRRRVDWRTHGGWPGCQDFRCVGAPQAIGSRPSPARPAPPPLYHSVSPSYLATVLEPVFFRRKGEPARYPIIPPSTTERLPSVRPTRRPGGVSKRVAASSGLGGARACSFLVYYGGLSSKLLNWVRPEGSGGGSSHKRKCAFTTMAGALGRFLRTPESSATRCPWKSVSAARMRARVCARAPVRGVCVCSPCRSRKKSGS